MKSSSVICCACREGTAVRGSGGGIGGDEDIVVVVPLSKLPRAGETISFEERISFLACWRAPSRRYGAPGVAVVVAL